MRLVRTRITGFRTVALVAALALFAPAPVAAFDFASLKPEGHVSDFARVLDPSSKAQLEDYARNLEHSTGAELALVTVPTLGGEPIEDVANLIFRRWGIGKKTDAGRDARDQGILLLLVVNDRRSRLEVGRGLEPMIPDGFAGSMLREMRPALREQRYAEALSAAAHTIGDRIAQSKGVALQPRPLPQRRQHREPHVPWPAIAGGLGFLLFSGLMGWRRRGRYPSRYDSGGGILPAILMGSILGRSMHSGSGRGGFGGYDSGDTFGGFGGGDSGGGGASSSW